MAFEIEFFETENGKCDVGDWLDDLEKRAETDKDARVQLGQTSHAIGLLAQNGTRNPAKIVEHLDGDIWELRPGCNRVMLFQFVGKKFVLLHHFRKTTQKTPPAELKRAEAERKDYLRRYGGNQK